MALVKLADHTSLVHLLNPDHLVAIHPVSDATKTARATSRLVFPNTSIVVEGEPEEAHAALQAAPAPGEAPEGATGEGEGDAAPKFRRTPAQR